MYAEVKNENTVLINRLDDSERILLKSIYDKSEDATITMKELTDESGDFGGVLVKVESNEDSSSEVEVKTIELKEAIPTHLEVEVGAPVTISIDTNIPNNDFTLIYNSDNPDFVKVDANQKEFSFIVTPYYVSDPSYWQEQRTIDVTINYSILATGYEPIVGSIVIATLPTSLVTYDFTFMTQDYEYKTVKSVEVKNEETSETYEVIKASDYVYRTRLPEGNFIINYQTDEGSNTQSVYIDSNMLLAGYCTYEPFPYELPQN